MFPIADFIAYDPRGQIALIAEAKSKTETSRAWAARMRRNMLTHGSLPNSRFFLLALPDRLYLWKDVGNSPELVDPTYEIDATPFLRTYYEKARISPDKLSGSSFELIVDAWLNELVQSGIPETVPVKERNLLLESGLLDAIKGGSVAIQVPA